ncbi:MAG TPA: hypothetical protein VF438_02890 [Candidatus Paceibacterota bacterium]
MKIIVRSLALICVLLCGAACTSTKPAVPVVEQASKKPQSTTNPTSLLKLNPVEQTILTYTGKSTDYVTQGKTGAISEASGATFIIKIIRDRWIDVTVRPKDGLPWHLAVGAPTSKSIADLVIGKNYGGMRLSNHPDYGELDFSGDGRGYNTTSGIFAIHELEIAPDGTVLRLAVDIFMHGDNMSTSGLMAALRYHSRVEIPVQSML